MQSFSNIESDATVQLFLFSSATMKTQETRIILPANFLRYRVTQKNGNFWKPQPKLKKSKKKKLLTEIEPLQLTF